MRTSLDIHGVERVEIERKRYEPNEKSAGFYTLSITAYTEDGRTHSIDLFGNQPIDEFEKSGEPVPEYKPAAAE